MKKSLTGIENVKTSGTCCSTGGNAYNNSDELLAKVVGALCDTSEGIHSTIIAGGRKQALPSRDVVVEVVEALRSILFPGYFGVSELAQENMRFHCGATLDHVMRVLQEQIRRGLCFTCEGDTPDKCAQCEGQAHDLVCEFVQKLPQIKRLLGTDVWAAYQGDPAVSSQAEAVFCYPGITAITNYRMASELYKLKVPLIPRMMTEYAHAITGIDIHPGAKIDEAFFIDHGTGVVIGETSIIGKRVRLYQGVTLGAKSIPFDNEGNPITGVERHPIVEDDVVIYAGATILGRVTIGKGSIIGGNVWLTRSIPHDSKITQAQVRQDRFEYGGGI